MPRVCAHAHRDQKRTSDSLGLEVQEVMSHPAWVPGNGTGVLWNNSTCSNFWDISPACFDIFIFYNLLHGMVAGGSQRTSSSRVSSLFSMQVSGRKLRTLVSVANAFTHCAPRRRPLSPLEAFHSPLQRWALHGSGGEDRGHRSRL